MFNRIAVLLLFCLFFAVACSSSDPADTLNGSWQSDMMNVTIDLKKGTYEGVVLGKTFNKKVKVVSSTPNAVVLDVDGNQITAQIQSEDNIILTKEKGIPVSFTRSK